MLLMILQNKRSQLSVKVGNIKKHITTGFWVELAISQWIYSISQSI